MSQELTIKQKNELAQNKFNELIRWKQVSGMSFLMLGKLLKEFRDNRLYENLGEESPEYESFEMFLQMPEIDIKLRKAYYLIQIYDTFCQQLKFKPEELSGVSWTALRSLLPCIREENSRDLVEKAKTLKRSDLDIEIRQLKLGIKEPEACDHSWSEITFWRCNKCHESSNIQPTDGKIIKE